MNKLSVVIPLHDHIDSIERALNSVLNQYEKVDEIIVVDDGSTDGSLEFIQSYSCYNLKLIEQPGLGVAAALNKGVASARNTHVAFLDPADTWLPFFTLEMKKLEQQHPHLNIFASRYQFVDSHQNPADAKIRLPSANPNGFLLSSFYDANKRNDLPFVISSMLISKARFEKLGGFPIGNGIDAQRDFLLKILERSEVLYSPNIHVHHQMKVNENTDNSKLSAFFSLRLFGLMNGLPLNSVLTQSKTNYKKGWQL